jgi:hypothetical protein
MRCRACQAILSDFEATRKYKSVEDYVELCENCYSTVKDQFDVSQSESEEEDYGNE